MKALQTRLDAILKIKYGCLWENEKNEYRMSLTILKVLDINSTNGLKSTQQQDHDLFILRGLWTYQKKRKRIMWKNKVTSCL